MATSDQPEFPYKKGAVLEVGLTESFSPSLKYQRKLRLYIQKVFEPFTYSPVCLVTVQETGETLVAKFFDRRCSLEYRENHDYDEWSAEREQAYRDYVLSGQATVLLKNLFDDDVDASEWVLDKAQQEVDAHDDSKTYYMAEVDSYHALEWLQGQNVPKLMASIMLRLEEVEQSDFQEYFDVQGVLMEFVEGFTIDEMFQHVPKSAWNDLIDEAVSIVDITGQLGVHNRDVSERHVIVRPVETNGITTYQPVLFDFGLSRLRDFYNTEVAWYMAKADEIEDCAIGQPMQRRAREAGGDYTFKSKRLWGAYEDSEYLWRTRPGTFEWKTSLKSWAEDNEGL